MKKPQDLGVIIERIRKSEQWRDNMYKEKWEENYKQYRSYAKPKSEGQSNIFVPYTFMQVETIKARVNESLFANRPYVSVLPRDAESQGKANVLQTLLDWQFNERMGIKREFAEDITSDACIFGTAVVYTAWAKKERTVKRREQTERPLMMEDGSGPYLDENMQPIVMPFMETVESSDIVYDDPTVQKIDIFDFFVDRLATTISDARYCGHVEYLTKKQVEQMVKDRGWKVNWKEIAPATEHSGGKEIRSRINGNSIEAEDMEEGNSPQSVYKVHHYWEENRHVVLIGGTQCVLDEENPFWHGQMPYDKVNYVPLSNEFYGMGVPEILRDLQAELNTSRNMRIDYNAMALRRMWKVRKGCGLTPKDLLWRQNGVLMVNELDDVIEIGVANLPASAFTNEEVIKGDMRDATGCHDIIMGLAQSDETATTTMTKDNNASLRFKYFINAIVDDILVPMAQKCVSLDQQFMDESRWVRIGGEEAQELFYIDPAELQGNYDVVYVGSAVEPMANKELNKQKMLEAYNIAMSNPLVQQDPNAQMELLRSLFTAMEIKEVEKLLPQMPQPEPPQQPAVGGGEAVVPPGMTGSNPLAAFLGLI